MFENVDGRTDAGVTGILLAHPRAFRSGEMKMPISDPQDGFFYPTLTHDRFLYNVAFLGLIFTVNIVLFIIMIIETVQEKWYF